MNVKWGAIFVSFIVGVCLFSFEERSARAEQGSHPHACMSCVSLTQPLNACSLPTKWCVRAVSDCCPSVFHPEECAKVERKFVANDPECVRADIVAKTEGGVGGCKENSQEIRWAAVKLDSMPAGTEFSVDNPPCTPGKPIPICESTVLVAPDNMHFDPSSVKLFMKRNHQADLYCVGAGNYDICNEKGPCTGIGHAGNQDGVHANKDQQGRVKSFSVKFKNWGNGSVCGRIEGKVISD